MSASSVNRQTTGCIWPAGPGRTTLRATVTCGRKGLRSGAKICRRPAGPEAVMRGPRFGRGTRAREIRSRSGRASGFGQLPQPPLRHGAQESRVTCRLLAATGRPPRALARIACTIAQSGRISALRAPLPHAGAPPLPRYARRARARRSGSAPPRTPPAEAKLLPGKTLATYAFEAVPMVSCSGSRRCGTEPRKASVTCRLAQNRSANVTTSSISSSA
jgi:hypothetical protein